MRILLLPVKFFLVFFFIFCFLAHGVLVAVQVRDKWKSKKRLTRVIAFWCRIGLRVINVDVIVNGPRPNEDNFLFISNHQSYMDILVMSSIRPASYVTSKDIQRMPLLGEIVILAGCLFVDRKSRDNLPKEIEELTEGLAHGLDVTVFPEATSTDGSSVIRFRRPLFAAAVYSGKKICPMMIRYKTVNGKPFTAANRDLMCWYGDMTFMGHLVKMLSQNHFEVELTYFEPVEALGKEPADLAESIHKLISQAYRPY
jgi:1-acyl-sn-glycerol-3-phosphate acyltransferase